MESPVLLRMGNLCIFQLCSLVILACVTLAIPAEKSNGIDGQGHLSKPIVALFVFGDSLYDAGNNNYINTTTDYMSNYLPYGETFFEFATGRHSNGRIIPDFIAKYANLPLIPPYFQSRHHQFIYGVNFASGGAGALVETHKGKVINLNKQLIYFKDVVKQLRARFGQKETEELLSNAVYIFSIGGNDLLTPDPIFSSFSSEKYIQMMVGNVSAVIKGVYKAGGRKFGFVSLLSLVRLPYSRIHDVVGNDGETSLAEMEKQYNAANSKEFKRLQKQLKGFIYSEFDFYTASNERFQNPSNYGFKEVKNACCGSGVYRATDNCGGKKGDPEYELCENPGEYFFWDSFHPTEKVYEQFAELMWDGTPTLTAPYTLKSLFQLRSLPNNTIVERDMFSYDSSQPCDGQN